LPFVSIIMPVRNEGRHLAHCLEGILRQDYPRERLEVIVADGMSEDDTRAILTSFHRSDPPVRVIDNPQRIVPTGLNAALRLARGEVIVRMDAHTEYAPDYVAQCIAVLAETGADNVGGPARTRAEGYWERAIAAAYHSRFACGGARFHEVGYEGPVDTVTYGCWKKEVFDRLGAFDEELVRNQDDEHNLRLTRAGGMVWQSPRIRSWYRPRGSLVALFRQYMQYGYWKVRVIQKHARPASFRHLIPGLAVASLAVLTSAAPFWQPALAAWVCLVGLYTLAASAASVLTARRSGWSLLPILLVVFWCYHFGYGAGFLCGLWDFVLRRKRTAPAVFSSLTRSPWPREVSAGSGTFDPPAEQAPA
jgi:glycosyltransferase involved in cell wall biosynthesis